LNDQAPECWFRQRWLQYGIPVWLGWAGWAGWAGCEFVLHKPQAERAGGGKVADTSSSRSHTGWPHINCSKETATGQWTETAASAPHPFGRRDLRNCAKLNSLEIANRHWLIAPLERAGAGILWGTMSSRTTPRCRPNEERIASLWAPQSLQHCGWSL
jgi:hypothetical protein